MDHQERLKMENQSGSLMVVTPVPAPAPIPVQADSDATMVRLWLHGRAPATARAYAADAGNFLGHVGKPLRDVTVGDVQAFVDTLSDTSPASRARRLSVVKSLLTYAHRLGFVAFNVGAAVKLPPVKNTLAERIMAERDVLRMVHLEADPRNHALLRLLYGAGLRISEVCGLRWRDMVARDDAGQVTVFGKGGKTRTVLLPAALWRTLEPLRNASSADQPVFRSAKGGPLDPSQVHRIVKAAAARAGLSAEVSAHWLRHAHVSHALDRGAPAHLVQHTVGHASLATTSRYAHARPNDSSARYLAV
jgi:integrase/recombinase XerD